MTTTENIRKELQDLVDSKYQEFHSALVPGIGNILGVRIPQLRILAKEIAKRDNWRMFVEATDTKFYEETMFFLIAFYKDIENSILQPNAFMMR